MNKKSSPTPLLQPSNSSEAASIFKSFCIFSLMHVETQTFHLAISLTCPHSCSHSLHSQSLFMLEWFLTAFLIVLPSDSTFLAGLPQILHSYVTKSWAVCYNCTCIFKTSICEMKYSIEWIKGCGVSHGILWRCHYTILHQTKCVYWTMRKLCLVIALFAS